jgi:hypothetical protein
MRPFDPNRLERTIHFHRIFVGGDARGLTPFDPAPALAALQRILATDDRYLEQGERVTLAIPDHDLPPQRLRLLNIRRTNLPHVEAAGVLTPLGLDPAAGLAEQIHLVFFPDNVVGSEFNFYGPRATRLGELLRARNIERQVELRSLVRDDVIGRLDDMEELTMATIRIDRAAIGAVRRIDPSLSEAFERTAEFSEQGEIGLSLRRIPHTRTRLSDRVRGAFRNLARDDEVRHIARALQVEGRNPVTRELELLDLLESELVTTRRILRTDPRSRVLDSEDAYAQINSAYDELLPEIRRAGTILDNP